MSTQEIGSSQNLQELSTTYEKGQYPLWQIPVIWLAASASMWLLGWVAYPGLGLDGLSPVDAGRDHVPSGSTAHFRSHANSAPHSPTPNDNKGWAAAN